MVYGMTLPDAQRGGASKPPPRQAVARRTTFQPKARVAPKVTFKPKPKPAPRPYNPPSYSPPQRTYSAPPSTTSSGQYSGGTSKRSFGGGGGRPSAPPNNNRQGPIRGAGQSKPKPAPKPKAPGIKKWLGMDDTYQGSISSLQKQLEDFILSNEDQRGDVRENFDLTQQRMGTERERALKNMEEDFGSRNMLTSSEYLDSVGKYDTDFQTKIGDLTRDRDKNIEDLLESLGMYRTSNQGERQNARAEAIRRRASKFGQL